MNLPSMPRMSECWALSRLDKTMLSPILSLDTSAKAPVPSLLPCMPDLKWVLLPCPLGIGFSFSNNRPRKSVLLLLRGWFRRLMAALAGIVVLVVFAFLVEATGADREFALPRLRPRAMNGDVPGIATRGLLEFSCVRHIRFALENAHLLLMGLSALHVQSPGLHRPLRGEPLRVVLDVALNRVLAESILDVVGRRACHGGALRSANQGIVPNVLAGGCVQLGLLVSHDHLPLPFPAASCV